MKQVQRLYLFLQKPFFSDYRTLLGLWLLLPVIATLLKLSKHNNFLIFRYVYWHTIEQLPLYVAYDEYWDTNHYGPFFSLVIAPFAMLPVRWGLFFWLIVLSLSLYYAIRKLPFPDRKRIFLYWFCAHELLTALFMSQFNIAIAAIIVATFYCIEKEKDIWAACFIMLGTFVKLYGIVGLAFFFFSKHKVKFLLALLGWALVMFVAPMAISSPDYIISQYVGWWDSLSAKNAENIFSGGQNISLLGMVRKFPDAPLIPICGLYSVDLSFLDCLISVLLSINIRHFAMHCWHPCYYLLFCSAPEVNPVPILLLLSGLVSGIGLFPGSVRSGILH